MFETWLPYENPHLYCFWPFSLLWKKCFGQCLLALSWAKAQVTAASAIWGDNANLCFPREGETEARREMGTAKKSGGGLGEYKVSNSMGSRSWGHSASLGGINIMYSVQFDLYMPSTLFLINEKFCLASRIDHGEVHYFQAFRTMCTVSRYSIIKIDTIIMILYFNWTFC